MAQEVKHVRDLAVLSSAVLAVTLPPRTFSSESALSQKRLLAGWAPLRAILALRARVQRYVSLSFLVSHRVHSQRMFSHIAHNRPR